MLASWARELPDLDTAPAGVVARLGRLVAYVDHAVGATLAEHGLRRSSWDVLATLRRHGSPYRLSPTALYQEGMRSSGAMTHRLRRLEDADLVERVPDPDDGRSVLVQLTAKGVELVETVLPAHLENERRLLSPLDAEEQRTLALLLSKLLLTFEQERPTPPPRRSGRRERSPGRDVEG